VGRPPRISRQAIAEAALEVGLEDLTLRAVAERLGVSVPSLYHHVNGRDELLQLAAERSVSRRRVPVDRDQHWAAWLLEWARYNRDAFVGTPGLLSQYVEGTIDVEAILENLEAILALLCRQGFDPVEGRVAYELVSACAIGFAVAELRARRAQDDGQQRLAAALDAQVTTVLRGIAAERGERWSKVVRHLDAVD
jgi:AcrR family transcriptional regulator